MRIKSPAAGQFFTVDLAGEPLIVVRGADDHLRAFYNVCRHHAAAVATAPSGVAQHLRCPYHGWTYGLDGSLKGAPEFAGVCNFDRAANGLVPVLAANWENFIFVNLNQEAPPLESRLGDLAQRISVSGLRFFARRSYTLACNWKVYVDNYLDGGYHVPHLHKALNSVLDYSEYTIENGTHYTLQSSPMVASQDASVANTRTGDRAYYYWLYPNFMINLYAGVMDTNLVLPLGQEKCLVVFDFFFGDSSAEYNAQSVAVSDQRAGRGCGYLRVSAARPAFPRLWGGPALGAPRDRGAPVSPSSRSRPQACLELQVPTRFGFVSGHDFSRATKAA